MSAADTSNIARWSFLGSQLAFLPTKSSTEELRCLSAGWRAGKSVALCRAALLLSHRIPDNFGFLGRASGKDMENTLYETFFNEVCPSSYILDQKKIGQTPRTNPSMASWDELPEGLKESNRRQADHIGIKLKAIGCGIASLTDWDAKLFEFKPEEVERMAGMEHERWNEERRLEGWTYAPEPKDLNRKTTPYLVPWNELSEDIKEYDRNTIRGLPAFLARAGFQIYRLKK